MKNLIFIALLYLSLGTFAQRGNTPINVADTATAFGVSCPVNQLIFNTSDSSFYCLQEPATKLRKLSNTLNYKLPSSGGVPAHLDTTNIIYSVGGNNVMGQPLVVMGDTVRPLPVGTADGQMLRWNNVVKRWVKAEYFIIDSLKSSFKNNGAFGGFGFNNATGETSFISGGNSNNATNYGTFIGGGSGNIASGYQSVAFGNNNASKQSNDAVFGFGNISKWGNHFTIGKYNDTTTVDHFTVGVGTNNTNRANAFRIGQDSGVYMPLLPSSTTPTTLYYNTTTKEVTYGNAPTTDTTAIYAALDSKADTSIITRFENDSIAKNTAIATKWSKTGDNTSFPNNYLGTTGSNDLRIGANGRNDIRIDSIVNGLITIGNGDNGIFPKIEFNYNNGTTTTQNNYITLASGGAGRLVLNGSASTDLYVGGSAVFRVTTSDFRPVGDNAQDLGATSNYLRHTYTNLITSNGTAARTWQVGRAASGAGNNLRINAGGAASGATDGNGGMFTVWSGNTTGTGFSSVRVGRYSRAISTGTADNTESDAMIIPSSKLMVDNTSTNLFNVACASGTSFGLTVEYTIKTVGGAGNESHTEVGTVYMMCSNDGSVTTTISKVTSVQHKSDAGTYTVTFAASAANPSVISVTADTDLNVNSVIHYNIINKDAQVINQL